MEPVQIVCPLMPTNSLLFNIHKLLDWLLVYSYPRNNTIASHSLTVGLPFGLCAAQHHSKIASRLISAAIWPSSCPPLQ